MTVKARSNRAFLILLAVLAAAAALSPFLPQGDLPDQVPSALQVVPPAWQLALAGAGMTLVLYGALGWVGMILARRLDLPEICDPAVSPRQRFLLPALTGAVLGLALIAADLLFSPINGMGRLPHPPFPTSLVASAAAGIGEEMLFRLFFISFWTWLVGKVVLKGRGLNAVYAVVSVFAALAFGASHLPSVMVLFGASSPAALPPVLLLEIFLLNGLIGLAAAAAFRRHGFLAPVGIHFWTDIVWHLLWGLV